MYDNVIIITGRYVVIHTFNNLILKIYKNNTLYS